MVFSSVILGNLISLYGKLKDSYKKSYLKWLLLSIMEKMTYAVENSAIIQGINSVLEKHRDDSDRSILWGGIIKVFSRTLLFLKKRIENSFIVSKAVELGLDSYMLIAIIVLLPIVSTSIIVALSFATIALAKARIIVKGSKFKYSKIYLFCYSIFIISMVVGIFFNIDTISGMQSFIMSISSIYTGLMIPYILDERKKIENLLKGIAGMLLILSIYGIYQKIFGAPMDPAWIDAKYGLDTVRIYSVFENPNVYGEYLILTIPIAFALFSTTSNKKSKLVYAGITGLGVLNLMFTLSRGSMIGLAIAMTIIVVLISRQYIPLMIAFLAVSPFILPSYILERVMTIFGGGGTEVDTSIAYRGSIYSSSLEMVKDHFITGVGLGQFREVYKGYSVAKSFHAHNTFLMIIIEGGLLSIISFATMGLVWSKKMIANISQKKDLMSFMSVSALASIAGCSAQGLADHIWHNHDVMFMYFAVIGIGYASYSLAGEKNER